MNNHLGTTKHFYFIRPKVVSTFLLLMVFNLLSPPAASEQDRGVIRDKPKLLWSVSLTNDADWMEAKRTIDTNAFGFPRVALAGASVIVSFLHSEHPELPPGYGGLMEPLRLKALVFSAKDGKARTILHWQARREDASLMPANDGGFVVHAGDVLMRYSPSLELVKRTDLPKTEPASHYRSAYSAVEMLPGGQVLFLRKFKETPTRLESVGTWLEVKSFDEITAEAIPDWRPVIPSADTLVRSEVSVVYVRQKSNWDPILKSPGVHASMFVNERAILLTGRRKVMVIDRSGKILFSADMNQMDPKIKKRSLRGNRFAVFDTRDTNRFFGRAGIFEGHYFAKVFDLNAAGPVSEIDVGVQDAREVDLALSEDGSYLAVLTGSTLSLFRLPVPSAQ
ncbi:MAG: hypothetical protein L0338_03075 [Acidobacteria bacterium]|nr:hypothetical protein [Acidobacteriota bacterium]